MISTYTEGSHPLALKTFSWDIGRFHHDGFILAETEFESPLKDWME